MDANELILKDEAYALIGAAMEVHSTLGPGFLEGVYGDALAQELEVRGLPFQREVEIPILYKGKVLPRKYKADFIAYGQIILELKAVRSLSSPDHAQTLNYLKATCLPLALLLNFGSPKLDWVRLVRTT